MRNVHNLTPALATPISTPSAQALSRPRTSVIPGMAPEAIPTRGVLRIPVGNGGSQWVPGIGRIDTTYGSGSAWLPGMTGVGALDIQMPQGAMRDVMMVAVGALAAAVLLKTVTRRK